jgi:cytochrome c-type biogenesis protein CcmE
MKAKHQRLVLAGVGIAAVLCAVLLAMSALKEQAAYFYAPADLVDGNIPMGRPVRVGGMVKEGSIRRDADGVTINFLVADTSKATIKVRFTGITPDLFKENGGVIAEGRFQPDGNFVATEILAKHDENYRPPEQAGERHKVENLR